MGAKQPSPAPDGPKPDASPAPPPPGATIESLRAEIQAALNRRPAGGCVVVSDPGEQIRRLTERLKLFTEFALAHIEFEAMLLDDDGPAFGMLPDAVVAKAMEVQALRERAMNLKGGL